MSRSSSPSCWASCSATSTPRSATQMKPLGDAFIKLVKMIIAPVIFLTVVTGIAGMSDLQQGRARRRQGDALFPDLLDAGADHRPDRRQCRAARRRHATSTRRRSTPATVDDLRRQGARPDGHRLPDEHHPDDGRSAPSPTATSCRCCSSRCCSALRWRWSATRGAPVLDFLQALTTPIFKLVAILMKAAPDRRVRGHGLHHRQVRHRRGRQPRRRWSAPST